MRNGISMNGGAIFKQHLEIFNSTFWIFYECECDRLPFWAIVIYITLYYWNRVIIVGRHLLIWHMSFAFWDYTTQLHMVSLWPFSILIFERIVWFGTDFWDNEVKCGECFTLLSLRQVLSSNKYIFFLNLYRPVGRLSNSWAYFFSFSVFFLLTGFIGVFASPLNISIRNAANTNVVNNVLLEVSFIENC